MIQSLWDDAEAARRVAKHHDPDVAFRLYASELFACEPRLTLRGSGNASVKTASIDLFGDKTAILSISENGRDPSLAETGGLASVKLESLLRMEQLPELSDDCALDFFAL